MVPYPYRTEAGRERRRPRRAAGARRAQPPVPRSPSRKCWTLERLPELDPDRSRLIHEQARPPGRLRRDRAAVAQVRDFIAEVLADERNLEPTAVESDVRFDGPVRGSKS